MTINLTRSKSHWDWSVREHGQELAAGFTKTKAAASSDAAVWIAETQELRAIAAGRIPRGAAIRIKPEWMDPGDENFTFFAIETQLEGMNEIRVRAIHKTTGQPGIGIQSIHIDHIESHSR